MNKPHRKISVLIFIITSLVMFHSHEVLSQETKKITESIALIQDKNLGIKIKDADAEYEYYLDNNQKLIHHGTFKASKIIEYTETNNKAGYASQVTSKYLLKISGKYSHGNKVGEWISESIYFGLNISGASFDYYQRNWNTLKYDKSNDIETIKKTTINYRDNKLDGIAKYEIIEKNKVVHQLTCQIKDNHFIGKFSTKNEINTLTLISGQDWNIECYFDNSGYLHGTSKAVNIKDNHILTSNYNHGVFINGKEVKQTTGEKLGDCNNLVLEYLTKNLTLPQYIHIDTLDVGKNYYTGRVSIGYSLKNNQSTLYSEQFTHMLKNKNTSYGVNKNCMLNTPPIESLNASFLSNIEYPMYRDVFFVSDSIYADKQLKGSNHPTYIDNVKSYRDAFYKLSKENNNLKSQPSYSGDITKMMNDKFRKWTNFGFAFFRVFLDSSGRVAEVVSNTQKLDSFLICSQESKSPEKIDLNRYNLKDLVPLSDSLLNKELFDTQWSPGKDNLGNSVPSHLDILLWKKEYQIEVSIKDNNKCYVKSN